MNRNEVRGSWLCARRLTSCHRSSQDAHGHRSQTCFPEIDLLPRAMPCAADNTSRTWLRAAAFPSFVARRFGRSKREASDQGRAAHFKRHQGASDCDGADRLRSQLDRIELSEDRQRRYWSGRMQCHDAEQAIALIIRTGSGGNRFALGLNEEHGTRTRINIWRPVMAASDAATRRRGLSKRSLSSPMSRAVRRTQSVVHQPVNRRINTCDADLHHHQNQRSDSSSSSRHHIHETQWSHHSKSLTASTKVRSNRNRPASWFAHLRLSAQMSWRDYRWFKAELLSQR